MASEELNQQAIRLHAAYHGTYWRNNNGACVDQSGRMVRYGLANDSAKLNSYIKSSDLIGITPLLITPEYVGKTVGVFTAIEAKRSDWKFTAGDKRAIAQHRFMEIVWTNGGFAGFAQTTADYDRIVRR